MIKFCIFFLVAFSPIFLFSKPYYSEYVENQHDKQFIVIFHGNISEDDEPKVKILEKMYLEFEDGDYLEYRHLRKNYENGLNSLGVHVEIMENEDRKSSEKVQHPPEFHHQYGKTTPEED